MVADHDGIQTTLIVMEIGSLDPQIQSCGLALLSCAIVESITSNTVGNVL